MIEFIAGLFVGIVFGICFAVCQKSTVIVEGSTKKVVEYDGKLYRLELDEAAA